jgi:hypothetical protein
LQKRAREAKLSTTEFENCLAWQKMNGVAKRLRAPQEAVVCDWIAISPILITEAFACR